ncbi:MAG TPA: CHASE3 domain-containing protein, partial [Pseudobacter sp.]|nr:CHASE3 domain-containing protein [Pseudobacter sp.]
MNSSFKRNLIIGFGFSLLLLVISSVASYMSIRNLLESSEQVEHTNSVIRKLDKVVTQLINAETGQRGYLLTGEENFLQPYQGAIEEAKTAIIEVKELTGDNLAQQQSLNQLQMIVTSRLSMLQKLIGKKQRGQQVTPEELQEGKKYMDQARMVIAEMVDRENKLLAER